MKQLIENELLDILCGKISSAINRAILRNFVKENIDITTEQWTVMACLWNKDKVTQQTLCTITEKDKPSITRLLDKLESRNYVVRVQDPTDRRINLIHLTEAGTALQKKATEIVEQVANKTLSNITEEELNLSREVLRKIIKNLK